MQLKTELQAIKKLNGILESVEKPLLEIPETNLIKTDPLNICMVIAKTTDSKRILSRFINNDADPEKDPENIDFNETGISSSKYNAVYLDKIFSFFNCFDLPVEITLKSKYPIKIENDLFKIILAPRVEN